jgi:hypothetical protein
MSGARETLRILSDAPTSSRADDHLEFKPYVDALALLIDQKETTTPLLVAISAPWGSGKTTIARMIQSELATLNEWDDPHITCWFNAWENDDAPHLGAAFAADIARQANGYRRFWLRILYPLPTAMLRPEQKWRRKLWILLAAVLAGVILVLTPGGNDTLLSAAPFWDRSRTDTQTAAAGKLGSLVLVFALFSLLIPRMLTGVNAVAKFVDDPKSEAASGSMAEVKRQLRTLLTQATRGNRRFVIFVDDLERCRPPRAVEVCEVASQLLSHRGIVTVLVADMQSIAVSAAIKYRAVDDQPVSSAGDSTMTHSAYGRAYLSKLVQLQVELPPPTLSQLRAMVLPLAPPPSEVDEAPSPSHDGPLFVLGFVFAFLALTIALAFGVYLEFAFVIILGFKAIVVAVLLLPILWGLIKLFIEWRRHRRTQIDRQAVTDAIRRQATEGSDTESLVAEARSAWGASGSKRTNLDLRRLAYSTQLGESEILASADELASRYLPLAPRAAKRLMNQLHLLLVIAMGRGLFGPESDHVKTARLLAKWCVLTERWPDLAKELEANPQLVAAFEATETEGSAGPPRLAGFDRELVRSLMFESPPFGPRLKTLAALVATPTHHAD